MRIHRWLDWSVCVVLLASPGISSAEPPKSIEVEAGDPLIAEVEKSVDRFELRWTADGQSLKPMTVLRWKNTSRAQEAVALMVIWPKDGRPVAQASIYPWNGRLTHEFGSLCGAGQIVASAGDNPVWTPEFEGLEWQTFEGGPAPADSPAARLRQMKQIAGQFEAVMTGWRDDKSDRETLRLLAKELYRYDAAALSRAKSKVRDGAMFAYVQGTDPEITMLLQAEEVEGKLAWRYAFTRATSGGVEAKLGSKVIWTAPRNGAMRDPTSANYNHKDLLDSAKPRLNLELNVLP